MQKKNAMINSFLKGKARDKKNWNTAMQEVIIPSTSTSELCQVQILHAWPSARNPSPTPHFGRRWVKEIKSDSYNL